jgi:hypothetical protein
MKSIVPSYLSSFASSALNFPSPSSSTVSIASPSSSCSSPNILFGLAIHHADSRQKMSFCILLSKDAGCQIAFATENGNEPESNRKMWNGLTQKLWVRAVPFYLSFVHDRSQFPSSSLSRCFHSSFLFACAWLVRAQWG